MKTRFSRRIFLKCSASLIGGSVFVALTGCVPADTPETESTFEPEPTETDMPSPLTATPTSAATATMAPIPVTATPSATSTTVVKTSKPLLRNQNLERVNIRYSNEIEPVDVDSWRLTIKGHVINAQELTLDQLKALPVVSQTSRLKCVESWSFAAKWQGFCPQDLFDLVQPEPEAKWVRFYCADDYFESLAMDTLCRERVLFAYDMNDAPLPPVHGAPLRLIVPFMYGYKGPKVIQKIVFAATEVPEDWIPVNNYGLDGTILPGKDYALDLGTTSVFNKKGEIFYEQGLESLDD
ncbi:MAG: molybdopterin-dependent oxidoreductase [Anaerolineae bacterium]|nr:molybdopterin-dependent oxidoreductase [Anaerolineae bacterium]